LNGEKQGQRGSKRVAKEVGGGDSSEKFVRNGTLEKIVLSILGIAPYFDSSGEKNWWGDNSFQNEGETRTKIPEKNRRKKRETDRWGVRGGQLGGKRREG